MVSSTNFTHNSTPCPEFHIPSVWCGGNREVTEADKNLSLKLVSFNELKSDRQHKPVKRKRRDRQRGKGKRLRVAKLFTDSQIGQCKSCCG
uniref:Uncharacterized protein n=1 Tax=Anguilla anguilla TaxID=7936 RepID=A0A0E9WZH3_ANGAN